MLNYVYLLPISIQMYQKVSVLIQILILESRVFLILLANRASTKQILLAQQEIHWPRATWPVLISNPESSQKHFWATSPQKNITSQLNSLWGNFY